MSEVFVEIVSNSINMSFVDIQRYRGFVSNLRKCIFLESKRFCGVAIQILPDVRSI